MSLTIGSNPIPINMAATHAPHAHHSLQSKTKRYEELSNQMSTWKNHEINLIVGDFNARLMEQLPQESSVIGKHICRNDSSNIQDLSEQQRQNRDLFAEFCLTRKMIPMNTWFDKPTTDLATSRGVTTTHFDKQIVNPNTHVQLDYILISDRWKNSKNIKSVQETILDSDHALLIADIKIKLANTKQKRRTTYSKQFRRPTDAQKQVFDQHLSWQILEFKRNNQWNARMGFDNFATTLQEAAERYFTYVPKNPEEILPDLEAN